MNWEHSVLNRIFRTSDFKISSGFTNINTSNNKSFYVKKIRSVLEMYNLNLFNIKINEGGAIYKVKENGNCFYFDYNTNYYFNLYINFFENENKFIKYEDLDHVGILDGETKKLEGKIYSEQLKIYFLKLLFIKEYDNEEFIRELNRIDEYLKYRSFVIGNEFSLYDITLLSIIQNWNNWKEREKYFSNNNNFHIVRWYNYLEKYLEIDYVKIDKYKETKVKEYLGETYELTSNQNLVKAVQDRDIEKTIKLLKEEENPNSRELDSFKTISHICCRRGDREMLDILIKYGCDLEPLDFEFMTPIFDAVYGGSIEICDFLINVMKVNVHHKEIQCRTAFYWAACNGDQKMVDYLLQFNVDINNASKMGRTPLSKAAWNGNINVVKKLCSLPQIKINEPDKNGRYLIHNAVWGQNGGKLGKKVSGINVNDSPESLIVLIDHGAFIEVEDSEGYTPLLIAASTNGVASLKILLEKGANPNHLNKFHASPLIEASRYGNLESVKTILNYGKNVELDYRDLHSMTALSYAVAFDRVDCINAIIEYKENNKNLNLNEINEMINVSIKSDSHKSFVYLIEMVKKNSFMNDSLFVKELENILDKIINLSLCHMFNHLCSEFPNLINNLINHPGNEIQFLIKSIILSRNLKIEKSNLPIEEEVKIEDKNVKKSQKKQLEEVEEDLTVMRNKKTNFEEHNYILFLENVENLFKRYLDILKERVFSIVFLKTLVYLNEIENFEDLFNIIQEIKDYIIKDDEIIINKENYNYIEIIKKRKSEKNAFDEWEETLIEINYHNLLTISLDKEEIFFERVMKMKHSHKYIFTKLKDEKNILHVIFSQEKVEKLNKIIHIVENEYKNKLPDFIEMLDEHDENNLTPLDIIMKNNLYRLVETYTKIILDLREKHDIKLTNQNKKAFMYKIQEFEVLKDEKALFLSKEFKNNVEMKLKEKSANLKNKISESVNFNESTNKLIKNKLDNIIEKINKEEIEKDFRINLKNHQYDYEWIDNEDSLINCVNHLSKFEFIGIDLEFFGTNQDDGIVCLLQISTVEKTFAIDTLKLRDEITKYLKPIFEDKNIVKIFHGCDNDIAWLITNFEIFTENIFDTERAFLVLQKYILNKSFKTAYLSSLYFLAKLFLQVELDKSYQKSDWRIRPLANSNINIINFRHVPIWIK